MKKWLLFVSAMCLVIVLAACGANAGKGGGSDNAVETSAGGGAAGSSLVITASNWEFDQKQYKIKAGETVNVKLDSIEGVHGIQIKNTDFEIGNGKTVPVTISKPGEYELICNVPCGIEHRSMASKLIVE